MSNASQKQTRGTCSRKLSHTIVCHKGITEPAYPISKTRESWKTSSHPFCHFILILWYQLKFENFVQASYGLDLFWWSLFWIKELFILENICFRRLRLRTCHGRWTIYKTMRCQVAKTLLLKSHRNKRHMNLLQWLMFNFWNIKMQVNSFIISIKIPKQRNQIDKQRKPRSVIKVLTRLKENDEMHSQARKLPPSEKM